jgi:elongation factor P
MKISAFEVRIGHLIEYKNKLWRVLKKSHVKPGKGGAFVQLEMKSLDGTKLNERFRSEDKVEKAYVEPRKMQFLYQEGDGYIFMDLESYEQTTILTEDLGDQTLYLLPNTDVQVNFNNDEPISVDLPNNVVLQIVETEVAIKGQTATSSGKPAVLETGLKVTVPQFVNVDERVKINTETGLYVERAD